MKKTMLYLPLLLIILLISCSQKPPQDPEEAYSNYKNEETLEGKIKIYENFKETNPDSDFIKSMLYNITNKISTENGLIEASDYLMDNIEFASSSTFNSLSWKIFKSGENLELGAALAKTGIEKARESLANVKETIPENLTEEEWVNVNKQSLASILDTYGCIERDLNNNAVALSSFEEAVELMDAEVAEVNGNYITALIKQNEFLKAKTSLEKFIRTGNYTKIMLDQLKEVYNKTGNSEKSFEPYLYGLKEKSRQKMIKDLKEKIINQPAQNFELYDLDGNIVKLSDFKGKIIILDFWATWCGPCIKSFPGMKTAVEKYSNDPNVKFLFVNTKERVEDKKSNAADFIEKNDYPFHVLLDDENKVVEKYSVRGIPTKFIIDKDQNIRFESIGFSGSEEKLVNELSIMISMIEQ
jgi:peroxiredoxin